jgi:hypothetical protein
MNLQSEIGTTFVTGIALFLVVGSPLWLSWRVERRRSAGIARQIALTDVIHRELGAVAAPEVRQPWLRGWTVSMAVPLEREATVGAVVRIAHELFSTLDRVEAPRLRIVLTPQEREPVRQAVPSPAPQRAAGKLTRAGARASGVPGESDAPRDFSSAAPVGTRMVGATAPRVLRATVGGAWRRIPRRTVACPRPCTR